MFQRSQKFIAEMKRRKVFHVGSIYLITAWGASLGAAELLPAFGVPDVAVRAFVIIAALGFPLALVLAWAFDITPEGVVRDPGRTPARTPEEDLENVTTSWAGSSRVRVRWQDTDGESSRDFESDFVIGRSAEAQLQIKEGKISRQHAQVFFEKGQWLIKDLGSRNGTLLNGKRIEAPAELSQDNEVVLFEGGPPVRIYVHSIEDETQLA